MESDKKSNLTKLPAEFTFWFTFFQKSKDKQMEEFEDNLKKIADFNTAEEFWGIYQHMKRPNSLPRGCEFFLFQKGIKPLWEDEANFGGGRLYLSMKKDLITNKVWEDLQISIIIGGDLLPYICGSVINIRTSEVFISVWIKECSDEKREEIKEWLKTNLDLPNSNCIRWKKHPNTEQMVQRQKELKNEAEELKRKQEELDKKQEIEEKKDEEDDGDKEEEKKDKDTQEKEADQVEGESKEVAQEPKE